VSHNSDQFLGKKTKSITTEKPKGFSKTLNSVPISLTQN